MDQVLTHQMNTAVRQMFQNTLCCERSVSMPPVTTSRLMVYAACPAGTHRLAARITLHAVCKTRQLDSALGLTYPCTFVAPQAPSRTCRPCLAYTWLLILWTRWLTDQAASGQPRRLPPFGGSGAVRISGMRQTRLHLLQPAATLMLGWNHRQPASVLQLGQ